MLAAAVGDMPETSHMSPSLTNLPANKRLVSMIYHVSMGVAELGLTSSFYAAFLRERDGNTIAVITFVDDASV